MSKSQWNKQHNKTGPKRGPKTKIWQLIWNQGPKISMIPNFEGFTLNNKNFKKLTFRGSRGQSGGSKPNFFNWYEIRTPKWVLYQILKVLRSKTKISKFWPFGGLGAKAGAQNQFFSTDMKSGPQNEWHIKFWRFYNQTQKFQNFDLSGARGAKRGPRTKIFPNTKLRPQNLSNLKCLRS